jgi:hypothetical protein
MPKLPRITAFVLFTLASLFATAQTNNNLTGVWKGVMKDSLSTFNYTLRIIKIDNGQVTGTGLSGNQTLYCETSIKGTLTNGHLIIYEAEIVRTNYKFKENVCLLGMDLSLNSKTLTGTFRPVTNEATCLPGVAALVLETEPEALPKIEVAAAPRVAPVAVRPVQERKLALIKELVIDADSAYIQLFDNGIVDGDMITLTDNNKQVFTNALLSTQPLKYIINNKESNTHAISFVAENLGSIPPNTGLMVVTANRQRWEINFSSDFAKTSYVRIVLRDGAKK